MKYAKALLAILCLHALPLAAQEVRARLDTAVIRIGEQAVLTLSLELRDAAGAPVQWPTVADTLMRKVEVVGRSAIDTLPSGPDRDHTLLAQRLTITSFDTGFHAIPPFLFTLDGREVSTEALLLEVRSMPLDSARTVRAARSIIEPPFNLLFWMQEHAVWWGGAVALLALAAALWWYLRRRPKAPPMAIPTVEEPLLDRTLKALRTLEGERLWQHGQHKAYHSRLTDLLRAYVEERFTVQALERTTDELLQELRVSPLAPEQQQQLANMLRLADLVKFAKAIPAPAENEQMMAAAIRFVESTAAQAAPATTRPATHGS